jgi:hypothetical protein
MTHTATTVTLTAKSESQYYTGTTTLNYRIDNRLNLVDIFTDLNLGYVDYQGVDATALTNAIEAKLSSEVLANFGVTLD